MYKTEKNFEILIKDIHINYVFGDKNQYHKEILLIYFINLILSQLKKNQYESLSGDSREAKELSRKNMGGGIQ